MENKKDLLDSENKQLSFFQTLQYLKQPNVVLLVVLANYRDWILYSTVWVEIVCISTSKNVILLRNHLFFRGEYTSVNRVRDKHISLIFYHVIYKPIYIQIS